MRVDAERLEWLRGWMEQNPDWSRKRLARELCVCWDWRNDRGRLKDFAARSFLLKVEAGGWIRLPALQEQKRRTRQPVPKLLDWEEPPQWAGTLQELGPVRLEVVHPGSSQARRWASLLERHHYLGFRVVGENLGYLADERTGREPGCLLFAAPAWPCPIVFAPA